MMINVFILILRSHEVNIENVIKCILKNIRRLNKDDIKINIVEEIISICIFKIILLNDISQQTHNKNLLHYFARINCQICYYFKKSENFLNTMS